MTAFDAALFQVLALRHASETPAEFLQRIARDLPNMKLPRAKPVKMVTRTTVLGRTVTEPATTKWPPNQGEYYVGPWPPAFITPRGGRCAKTRPIFS